MTSQNKASATREKHRARLLQLPGVRTISRPAPSGGAFDLAYVRTGPTGGVPVVWVFPASSQTGRICLGPR